MLWEVDAEGEELVCLGDSNYILIILILLLDEAEDEWMEGVFLLLHHFLLL